MGGLEAASGLRRGERAEPQVWSEGRTFPGEFNILPEAVAADQARREKAQGTIWTDGSRLGDGSVGVACSWQTEGGWRSRRFFLGSNKEVFDAELYAIYQTMGTLEAKGQTGRWYTVFSDSQAAIRRAVHDGLGPGQQWARATIEAATRIMVHNNRIWVCWVPARRGIQGNETADRTAKEATGG